MSKTESLFTVGQMVQLRADPTQQGAVIEVLGGKSNSVRYRVFHSATRLAEYYGEQLAPLEASKSQDEWLEALTQEAGLSPAVFRSRLTAARLAHPLSDTLYALTSSRIQFIPFQFRPLLKLLRSDQPRLLIADEVGVGKTIESGLILRELQARQELKNVMVVCPKALVYKWRAELRRFEESFRILDSSNLAYCLKETYAEGLWPSEFGRAILPLELLRREENLMGKAGKGKGPRGLMHLVPPPCFDLLIVDEAHHVRNPGTLSHMAARYMCDVSVATIFLSATPVHLGSENLFHLLNLLRPDLFLSRDVFDEMVEPTRHLHQASRLVRQAGEDWQSSARSAMESASATRWGQGVLSGNPAMATWLEKLAQPSPLSDQDRVALLGELDDLQPFAGIINRTRRRDIGQFTMRDPHTVQIEFTPPQLALYEGVLDFRRRWLAQELDPLVVRLITDTLERQAASCIPALADRFKAFLRTGRISRTDLTDIDEESALVDAAFPDFLFEDARHLASLAEEVAKGPDPKFEQLEIVVDNALAENGSGKILIFSFFLHTLEYLLRGLKARGYRVELITGSTPDLEREALRERFSRPRGEADAIDVLLSSEVGCEGLDYQFCDRLVNYDIPWNPMRIEQRIGRIDRFGQKSPKVLIFNFVTPGTVEERIYFRCFERLGVFQQTLGDLEGVLGEATADLTKLGLDVQLSPEEVERHARQIADNCLRRVQEERRLEQDAEALLGATGLRVEKDELDPTDNSKFLGARDLREMVEAYLSEARTGLELVERSPKLYRLRSRKGADPQPLLHGLSELERSEAVIKFQRFLQLPDQERTLTFDQDVASQLRNVEFITPLHPLARTAALHWDARKSPLVAHLQVDGLTDAPHGSYVFLVELWEHVGVRTELHLVHALWNLETRQEQVWPAGQLAAVVSQAREGRLVFEAERLELALEELQDGLADRRRQALRDLQKRNDFLAERQTTSLDSYYRSRFDQIARELAGVTEERVRRMKASERQRLETEQKQRRDALLNRREADILTNRVAAGTLRIC